MLFISIVFIWLVPLVSSQSRTIHHLHKPKIEWRDCRDQVPLTLDLTGLNLDNLPSTLYCGEITVPMNYAEPISAQNNITVGLAMYRPEKEPKGIVFFNPGGSDEATVFARQVAFNQTEEFSGLTDFDLMMMDVRGTYHPNPLNVSLDRYSGLMGPYPITQTEFDTLYKASTDAIQSWTDLSYPPGILEYVGTKEVIQDFESIRRALCYDTINFIGASYGSFRAAQYAAVYPNRVGNFALDSVAPHGVSLFQEAQDQIAAANRGLLRADAYCQNNNSCPFKSQGKGSIPKKVLAAAQKTPLIASYCINSTNCTSPVTASNIQVGLQNSLLGQPDFPTIFKALEQALQGDASLFAIATGDPISDTQTVWSLPLLCSDYNLGNNTFEAFRSSLEAGLKASPSNFIKWLYASLIVLPAPTEWTRLVWEQNQESGLLIRHGDDHVSIQLPSQPSSSITKEFIRTGKLPATRNETLVSVYAPGMQVRPIADPYDVPTGAIVGDVDSDS
ncbi:hypothetical protein AOQ84DRAFT_373710 [Glonium stellatum]|uniref:AB hydrolase-1 domain-containing protein n=1 Tax=Glonium stellatum TaxID=574774 RepID=A0A8E2JW24_9PEZI|nr:hypothetical protein AOQ84DRAFT_373710 [Glonium stellatum]